MSSMNKTGQSDAIICMPPSGKTMEPSNRSRQAWDFIRYRVLTVYRLLFSVVIIANLAGMVVFFGLGKPWESNELALTQVPLACSLNFFVCVLIRNEHVVNALYRLAFLIPRRAPLQFRVHVARIYHLGGIHSGTAVAGALWMGLLTALIILKASKQELRSIPLLVDVSLTMALVIGMLISAFPSIRAKHHDCFEIYHRYAGWTIIVCIWFLLALVSVELAKVEELTVGKVLLASPGLWLQTATSILVFYPWLRVRSHKVESKVLSSHVVQITVNQLPGLGGGAIRIAKSRFGEYHSFAVIPHEDASKKFSILVSRVGDFTSSVIENPRSQLYIRQCHALGVVAIAAMFSPVLVVGTGSGIGPCLGVFAALPGHPFRILWSTRNPERTYGTEIVKKIRRVDEDATIIDTDVSGRIDIVKEAEKKFHEVGAEAIIVISRKQTIDEMVTSMSIKGIPCFGPIFDS